MSRDLLAVDTDVLVHWLMAGARHHTAARALLADHLAGGKSQVALAPQVLHQLLHVVTDGRRFERPLAMVEALACCRELWEAPEVVRLEPQHDSFRRMCSLMERHRLGRKRILDTALAALLEITGVRRLATLDTRDFRIFSFLELVTLDS